MTLKRPTLWTILRVSITLLLCFWVVRSIHPEQLTDVSNRLNMRWFLGTLFAVIVLLLLSAYRWKLLLALDQVYPSLLTLLRYNLHGQFFLQLFPSFIGADAIRAWDIRAESGKGASGAISVLIERLAGLHAVTTVSFIALLVSGLAKEYPILLFLTIVLFIAVNMAGGIILQAQYLTIFINLPYLARFKDRLNSLQRTAISYRKHPSVLVEVWLWSLGIQFMVVLAMFCNLRVLGYSQPIFDLAAITAIIVFVSAIPLSPAALGLQEGIYIVMLGRLGIPSGDALVISFLTRLSNILVALLGGLDMAIGGFIFKKSDYQDAHSTDKL